VFESCDDFIFVHASGYCTLLQLNLDFYHNFGTSSAHFIMYLLKMKTNILLCKRQLCFHSNPSVDEFCSILLHVKVSNVLFMYRVDLGLLMENRYIILTCTCWLDLSFDYNALDIIQDIKYTCKQV